MSSSSTVVTTRRMQVSSRSSTLPRGPIAGPKTVVINRTLPGFFGGSPRDSAISAKCVHMSRSLSAAPSVGQASADVASMLNGRVKEKTDMQELNERFAGYIEKVRFLEAQNKRLSTELQQLKDRWGKETEKVKQAYESELAQLRKLLDESDNHKAECEVRISSLGDQLNELQVLLDEANRLRQNDRDTIEKLNQQMADYDGEISLLRRRVANFDEERSRDQREIKRLRDEVNRLRTDLDEETLKHINFETEAQSLREELEFIKQIHESELKELATLAYRDTTNENREFWKNEMAQALRDIQREYDLKLDTMRTEVESQYSMKFQEARTTSTRDNMELNHLREENKRIKSQMTDARNRIPELEARNAQLERDLIELTHEMEEAQREYEITKGQLKADLSSCQITLDEYIRELQVLMDAKLSLELEILAYRKLLEGEEIRIGQQQKKSEQTSVQKSTVIEKMSVTVESKQRLSPPVPMCMAVHQERDEVTVSRTATLQKISADDAIVASTATQQKISGDDVIVARTATLQKISADDAIVARTATQQMTATLKGEMSAKTTYQRTSKGNVTIQECSADGKFIILENTGKMKEDISGWKISRNVDNGRQIVKYTIPMGLVLDSAQHKTVKIWARGLKPLGSSDLEAGEFSWGVGANITSSLFNMEGDERATHTQKTVYSAN